MNLVTKYYGQGYDFQLPVNQLVLILGGAA